MRVWSAFPGTISLVLLLVATAGAGELLWTLTNSSDDLSFSTRDGWDVVGMKGSSWTMEPGKPQLPERMVHIAIPSGTEATGLEVVSIETSLLPGDYRIAPAQRQRRLSDKSPYAPTEALESVYRQDKPYPENIVELANSGSVGGLQVAGLRFHPVVYNPVQGTLELVTRLELALEYDVGEDLAVRKFHSPQAQRASLSIASRLVENPLDLSVAVDGVGMRVGETTEYVIITGSSLASAFEPLKAWKNTKGVSCDIFTTSWIYSNYSGVDNPERIRNFIKDYFSNHGTVWVLLGGDHDVVPLRYAKENVEGTTLPCDLYYSDLDRSWDEDHDQVWGEHNYDQIDYYADVLVGRAPVRNTTEASDFVEKILTYEGAPAGLGLPTDYQKDILFTAEIMWTNPYTDGGVAKDMIDDVSVPTRFDPIDKLYERDGNLYKSSVMSALNAGMGFVNHQGHANYNVMSIGPGALYRSDLSGLTNSPRFGIWYSIGCWSAALDYDSIGERWLTAPNGGGSAMLANSRYGWGSPGAPGMGTSELFDQQFFISVFVDGFETIGEAFADHKHYFVPTAGNKYNRYCMYEMNLLGDPEMTVWTDTPVAISEVYPSVIPTGPVSFIVAANRAGVPLEGGLVSIASDGVPISSGFTDENGHVQFDLDTASEGTLDVVITGRNSIPHIGQIEVIGGAGDTEAPAQIATLTAVDPADNGGNIDLDWSGYVSPPDFSFYKIYRSESSFTDVGGMTEIASPAIPGDMTSWTDATAPNGVSFYYAVTAVDMFLNEDAVVQCVGPVAAVDNTEYLIWDSDDGDTPFSGAKGDYGPEDGTEQAWTDALGTMGKITRCVTDLPSDLSIYKGVIYLGGVWNFGGDSQEPMTDTEADLLRAFILGGGDLYIEEPNFGTTYWLYGSPSTIALFDELHCTYAAGNPSTVGNVEDLFGVGGSDITDGMSFGYPYMEEPDHVVGIVGTGGDPDCRLLFSDQSGNDRGTIYTDPLTGSDRAYAPFILGACEDGASPSTKAEYVEALLAYFESNAATGIDASPAEPAERSRVEGVFPNPFNPKAVVEFSVARDEAHVEISVFDISGRLVRTLADGMYQSGRYSVEWTGTDQAGIEVGSGVYLYKANIGGIRSSGKMVLLK